MTWRVARQSRRSRERRPSGRPRLGRHHVGLPHGQWSVRRVDAAGEGARAGRPPWPRRPGSIRDGLATPASSSRRRRSADAGPRGACRLAAWGSPASSTEAQARRPPALGSSRTTSSASSRRAASASGSPSRPTPRTLLAGHHVPEPRPRLLLDVGRGRPALLLGLELVDRRWRSAICALRSLDVGALLEKALRDHAYETVSAASTSTQHAVRPVSRGRRDAAPDGRTPWPARRPRLTGAARNRADGRQRTRDRGADAGSPLPVSRCPDGVRKAPREPLAARPRRPDAGCRRARHDAVDAGPSGRSAADTAGTYRRQRSRAASPSSSSIRQQLVVLGDAARTGPARRS